MKKLLSANLKVWHLLAGMAVIALATTGGVVLAGPYSPAALGAKVEAVTPAIFAPAGTFRMSAASSHDSFYVKEADGELVVLSTVFNVPKSKFADIAAFFNAEAYKYQNGYCYLKFRLDSPTAEPIEPGQLWVADGYIYKGAYPTISAQGFSFKIAGGLHTLYVTISATGGDCFVDDRSLIVMVNQRD